MLVCTSVEQCMVFSRQEIILVSGQLFSLLKKKNHRFFAKNIQNLLLGPNYQTSHFVLLHSKRKNKQRIVLKTKKNMLDLCWSTLFPHNFLIFSTKNYNKLEDNLNRVCLKSIFTFGVWGLQEQRLWQRESVGGKYYNENEMHLCLWCVNDVVIASQCITIVKGWQRSSSRRVRKQMNNCRWRTRRQHTVFTAQFSVTP